MKLPRIPRSPARRRLFISYRRSDSAGYAHSLYDGLCAKLGKDRMFMDLTAIPGGADFVDAIERELASCVAVLVVIGPEWESVTGDDQRRRLDDPGDYVRYELATALKRTDPALPILPVLVGDAKMPDPDNLPDDLKRLTRLNALEVCNSRRENDVQRVIATLLQMAPALRRPPVPIRWLPALVPTTPLAQGAAIVAAAALLGAAILFAPEITGAARTLVEAPPPTSTPTPLTGDLRVAVAQFGVVGMRDTTLLSQEANDLANSVYALLNDQVDSLVTADGGPPYEIGKRPPNDTGPIVGDTSTERADAAASLAASIGADLVIYGTFEVDGDTTQIVTEMYVANRQLFNAEELTGHFQLGRPLDAGDPRRVTISAADRRSIREQVLKRVVPLVEFTYGLGYYVQGDLQRALSHFQASASSPSWESCSCGYIVPIFVANTYGRLGDLAQAARWYNRAHDVEPQSARAILGLAEAEYLRVAGTCTSDDADQDGLQRVLTMYQNALNATVQPALSDIRTKVAYSTARVQICLSQALKGNYWAAAKASLTGIADEFNAGNTRIQDRAAEAHALLAFIAMPPVGADDPTPAFRAAEAEYREAIRLSRQPKRQAVFYASLGSVYARLGDTANANQAYDEAIRLDPDSRQRYDRLRPRS